MNEFNNENNSYSEGNKMKMHPLKKCGIIILSVLLFIVCFSVIDIVVDPPAFWRTKRQQDKKAILSYVEMNYPETIKRKGSEFPIQTPAGPFENSVIYFELDGIDFSISAYDGEIIDDTYYEAKAEKYIREKYIDGFMNERGLTPDIKITFVSPLNHYGMLGKDVLDDVYNFKGSIRITIKQPHIVGISTPRDVGWFYDFYQYWTENCDLNNCVVNIYYFPNNDYSTDEPSYKIEFVKDEKTFSSEKDFYNHFTA